MAANPVGADNHDGADTVENGALHLCVRQRNSGLCGFGGDFRTGGFGIAGGGHDRPFPRQSGGQVISRHRRPIGTRPGRTGGSTFGIQFTIAKGRKKCRPTGIHRRGIGSITRLQLVDIFGIPAIHEGGRVKLVIGGLVVHSTTLPEWKSRARRRGAGFCLFSP